MKILKIGGSVITDKDGYKKPSPESIAQMAKVVAEVWKKGGRDLVVVHGAGSFGHAVVLKHGITEGVKDDSHRIGYADTHAACSELSLMLTKALIAEGIPAVSLPPAAIIRQKNKRIEEFNEAVVSGYLSAGYLPVLYGDVVPDSELGGSVCSGDQIMAWLGRKADFLVFATDVDGVLDDEGNLIPEITKENFQEVSKHFKERSKDVTGAMKGKIEELLGIGTTSYIANSAYPERIAAILHREKAPCTMVRPHHRS